MEVKKVTMKFVFGLLLTFSCFINGGFDYAFSPNAMLSNFAVYIPLDKELPSTSCSWLIND